MSMGICSVCTHSKEGTVFAWDISVGVLGFQQQRNVAAALYDQTVDGRMDGRTTLLGDHDK